MITAPPPSRGARSTLPPSVVAIERATPRPTPTPAPRVWLRKNGSNAWVASSLVSARPLSDTSTTTRSLRGSTATTISLNGPPVSGKPELENSSIASTA